MSTSVQPIPSAQINVDVEFQLNGSVATFQFVHDGMINSPIDTDPGLNLLVFRLQNLSPAVQVTLAQNPFIWVQDTGSAAQAITIPACFSLRRETDQRATLMDFNTLQQGDPAESHSCHVSVLADGEVYTSPDPTIINRGAPSGG